MKINGQKYLFSNWFDRLVIIDENDEITCRLKPSISGKLITGKNICGNFKDELNASKDDYEKVLKLVNYFLRYDKVTELREHYHDYRVNCKNSIEVKGNRQLLLAIDKNPYGPQILENIMNKHFYDIYQVLYDAINKEEVTGVYLYGHMEGSCIKVDNNGEYDLSLERFKEDGTKHISVSYTDSMKERMSKIILELVSYLLEQNQEQYIKYSSYYMFFTINPIYFELNDEEMFSQVQKRIEEHNNKIFNNMHYPKQLKLKYRKKG